MTKELFAAGPLRSEPTGNRKAAQVETGKTGAGKFEEPILAEYWIIALPAVAIERIVPVLLDIRVISGGLVALPGRHCYRPSIWFKRKTFLVARYYLGWEHRRFTWLRITQTGINT